jgi:hypothetical protein
LLPTLSQNETDKKKLLDCYQLDFGFGYSCFKEILKPMLNELGLKKRSQIENATRCDKDLLVGELLSISVVINNRYIN